MVGKLFECTHVGEVCNLKIFCSFLYFQGELLKHNLLTCYYGEDHQRVLMTGSVLDNHEDLDKRILAKMILKGVQVVGII